VSWKTHSNWLATSCTGSSLPPQDLGGVVKLEIVRFSLGKITVEGNERFTEANVRASLPELKRASAQLPHPGGANCHRQRKPGQAGSGLAQGVG